MKIIPLLVSVTLLTGCTTYFKKSYISIKDEGNNKTVGTLLVWDADISAAILYEGNDGNSKACMQTALAIKTSDVTGKAAISDSILTLSKTASDVMAQAAKGQQVNNADTLADISGSIKQAAKLLTTTTEKTAFLNMGMFYICQLSANGDLSTNDTLELVSILIKSAAEIDGITPPYSEKSNKVVSPVPPAKIPPLPAGNKSTGG